MRVQKEAKKVKKKVKRDTPRREFSSGGIVARKRGRSFLVLLIKDGYGRWTWPKGNIDKGETAQEAALREIGEEVGITDIHLLEKVGKTEYFYRLRGRLTFKTVYLYLCETRQARLVIQKTEIDAGRWFSPKEALKKVEYRGAKELLKKALDRFASLKKVVTSIALLIMISSLSGPVSADSLYLSDKSTLKGIVVEDYVDRVVFSTIDGEKEILKTDIIHIEYDETADNLMSLGDAAHKNGYYKAALKYYMMAQAINPNMASLESKIYHTETIIYKTPELRKREHLALKNEIISGETPSFPTMDDSSRKGELLKQLGIKISRRKHGRFYIDELTDASVFRKAGIRKGDAIVAVWSRLCDYLTLEDISKLLLDKREAMMLVTVERTIVLPKGATFDAKLEMQWEGVMVDTVTENSDADRVGLRVRDNLVAIDGDSIRYAPLKDVVRMLTEDSADRKKVTIRRKLNVFKST